MLQHAHLLGHDDIGVSGDIAVRDGVICCDRQSEESTALAVMADLGECGRLLLQTCLLPSRDEPYLLHVELARHRVKSFLVKFEDWQLFDLPPEHTILREWEAARDALVRALGIQERDPAAADALGREALIGAIGATNRLAILHADALLSMRLSLGSEPRPALGCAVHQSQFAEPLGKIMSTDFDYVSLPIRWRELEPEEGQYDWSRYDRWMEWARRARCPVMLGPIIDFRALAVPEWLYIWEHDYDTTYDLLHEHIEAIVNRYRDVVTIWNVVSSVHINDSFTLGYEQLMDLTRMATSLVKSLHPAGKVMIEISEVFGEYYAQNNKSLPPIVYAETVASAGFNLDCLGVRLLLGHHKRGMATRDLFQVSSLLDRLVHLELPVIISALGAPSRRPAVQNGVDPAGHLGTPWDPQVQSDWLARACAMAASKPFVESVCVHELFDHAASELPAAGLITSSGRAKPSLARMGEVHGELSRRSLRCSIPSERDWVERMSDEALDYMPPE